MRLKIHDFIKYTLEVGILLNLSALPSLKWTLYSAGILPLSRWYNGFINYLVLTTL
jgi:hypothetical protein